MKQDLPKLDQKFCSSQGQNQGLEMSGKLLVLFPGPDASGVGYSARIFSFSAHANDRFPRQIVR